MKKLISVIPITILICILLSSEKAYAYNVNYYYDSFLAENSSGSCIYVFNSNRSTNIILCNNSQQNITINNGIATVSGGFSTYTLSPSNSNLLSTGSDKPDSRYLGSRIYSYNVSNCNVVRLTGNINISGSNDFYYFHDRDSYLNPPTPTPTPTPVPTWYGNMWDKLQEELGNPAFWFGEWFIDIIDQVFENEEEPSQGPSRISDSTHIKQVTPAPTPTPIPYSTITVPKTDIITGTTVYETNYYYTDSNGNNVVATSPPTNTPAQDNSGGGSGDNYNPVDPYAIPQVSWFTDAEIGDTSYDGIDSIMQGFDSIDTIGNDYTDGMSAVEDATGTLPTSWLLLIGIAAAIPLIAGIISRFLS